MIGMTTKGNPKKDAPNIGGSRDISEVRSIVSRMLRGAEYSFDISNPNPDAFVELVEHWFEDNYGKSVTVEIIGCEAFGRANPFGLVELVMYLYQAEESVLESKLLEGDASARDVLYRNRILLRP